MSQTASDDRVEAEAPPRTGGRGINQIALVGRLARDPELRTTGEGVARAWFVLAVPRGHSGADGDQEADFISIVAWRQLASTVSEHLKKGRLVGVTGRLRISTFDGQDRARRTTTEVVADQVVFLDAPRKAAAGG